MAEILRETGYDTTCVGFSGPSARGFDTYLNYSGWGPDESGRSPKAENLNKTTLPELNRLIDQSDENRFFYFCGTWIRIRPIYRLRLTKGCSITAMNAIRATPPWNR